jgi:hypothetical protein
VGPAAFQSRRVLKALNVAAVGFALAAVVSAIFSRFFHFDEPRLTSLVTALPTWALGTSWALLLRWPKTVGKSKLRWGWVASVPLAALNSSLAAGLLFGSKDGAKGFFIGLLGGATLGAILWIPALIATLAFFGVPIAHAQRLAKEGLAGEERGEWSVGAACVVASLVGLFLSSLEATVWTTPVLAVLGTLTGGAAAVFALAREARRRQFVTAVEGEKIPGYRIDTTKEGKVLVRIVSQGEGYRVADFEEELFELDARGQATQPRYLPSRG